jgi:3-oxoacyl-[acyl-carrier protein] reductase
MRLADRVALITGAGRGIGRAVALSFAEEGAHLALAARSVNELVEVAKDVQKLGPQALPQAADVTDESAVSQLVERARAVFGRIDILVNNAGVMPYGSLEQTNPAVWRHALEVNLTGAYLCTRAVLPIMIGQGDGAIVNIAARAGREAAPLEAAFAASKFGLIGLTRALAAEVREQGVRVNAICPGAVDTQLLRDSGKPFAAGDLLTPQDVARAAVYLASDESKSITGVALEVYGKA